MTRCGQQRKTEFGEGAKCLDRSNSENQFRNLKTWEEVQSAVWENLISTAKTWYARIMTDFQPELNLQHTDEKKGVIRVFAPLCHSREGGNPRV